MLTFENSLYLVELKNKKAKWKTKAENQLRNTISLLQKHNEAELNVFKKKKAFACNRKHPYFQESTLARLKQFSDETNGFRLVFKATIKIK